ncbi:TonB-dependent receptor [Sphingomonas sp. AP4-R1]|uniref:TonB-dependent receptor n=1 Tax=Sphingomonas sp. AP4-R1 TaxID=2735134 RepID=UPI0014935167|nr:TonB-dependent receptor [Sphingomonas sp. AP4-R1]QJU58669.1 TonB-dependent receptor [Sphingomonas sp. AP4-R1]
MRFDAGFRKGLMIGAALVVTSAPAMAMAADPAPADAPAADADSGGLNDIVVTATKRETNLQKTPISISVVSSQMIQDRHVQSLLDLADGGVPSLRVATFEARQSALTVGIRGIVPFDQNQTARDIGVGVYIDGVYLGRSQGLNAALFDVQRIEVLKGPQGTLFGRNTEGGAVSIVTAEPTGEFGGRISAGYGNYGAYTTEGHINIPAFDNLAFKFDGVIQHQDATTKNPLDGQLGWNYYNRKGGRVSAKWTPFDGFKAVISGDMAQDNNTPYYSQLVNYNPQGRTVGIYGGATGTTLLNPATGTACSACIAPLSPLVQVSGDKRMSTADIGVPQQASIDKTHGISANLSYDVVPGLTLRSITAWRGVQTDQWDSSGGLHRQVYVPNGSFNRYSLSALHQNQFSQEFQAVGNVNALGGNIDYVAGLYYFNEHVMESAATPTTNKFNADGTAYTIVSEIAPNPNAPITSSNQGWDRRYWFYQRASRAVTKSYAAFAQATYTPAALEQVHLTVGGRWTKDKRDGTLYTVSGVSTNYQFNYNKDRFDPMVTLAFDATENMNLYGKFSTGYRAGGANDRSSNFGSFGPEKVKSYEIGAKTDFLDHKVRFNVAGYIMDRTGTQIDFDFVDTNAFLPGTTTANPNFNLHTENTANAPGTSKIRGVEADLTVRPIEGLTLGGSYAYTYTKIPRTANPNPGPTFGVLTQVFTVYTPKHAASGTLDYELPMPVVAEGAALRLHLDANYASPQHSFQNESVMTDSSFIVNGRLALAQIPMNYANAKLTVSVWTRNLFNETHIYRMSRANDAVLGSYANFNPPRTFGVEAGINF